MSPAMQRLAGVIGGFVQSTTPRRVAAATVS